jgi:hypothetical protein
VRGKKVAGEGYDDVMSRARAAVSRMRTQGKMVHEQALRLTGNQGDCKGKGRKLCDFKEITSVRKIDLDTVTL